ncbi:sulfurtransferase TusA family protein [Actinoplanes sp. NPDC049681]|uniref:sulfurtransferase TusA family protein n=1 Tax=Actinoplanes sp. NPDC049681 TaxID=3363905 RepID=UPI0037B4A2F5
MTGPVVLDGGDRRCVQLLIELRRLILAVPTGAVIHLIATDPAAPVDLPAWCHLTGHTYLGAVHGTGRATYAVQTTAAATTTTAVTDPDHPWRPMPAAQKDLPN